MSVCPNCGGLVEDLDGFGVLAHLDGCGYCSHFDVYGDVCRVCGATTETAEQSPPESVPARLGGEAGKENP